LAASLPLRYRCLLQIDKLELNWMCRCRCATTACFKLISCNRIGCVAAAALPMLASNRLAAIELAASLPLRYRWLLEID
jgi:hypothetical protein